MKRLYMLRDSRNKPFQGIPKENGPLSFEKKPEAKARRDELNNTKFDGYPFTVSAGPDHRNYVE